VQAPQKRALILLVVGIVLLVGTVVLLIALGPTRAADGSRPAFAVAQRVGVFACATVGSLALLLGLYRLVTSLLPHRFVRAAMLVVLVVGGIGMALAEALVLTAATSELAPGSGSGDHDWD
jgi:hypothetical protein